MSTSTIGWAEGTPSNASAVQPRDFRSLLTNLAQAIRGSLYWPGPGGDSLASIGVLRPGGSAAFYGVQSLASGPTLDHVGRAYLCSDTTRLLTLESAQVFFAGSPRLWEMATAYAGQNYTWVLARGAQTGCSAAAQSKNISFGVVFNGVPEVYTSVSEVSYIHGVSTITTGGFTSQYSYIPITFGVSSEAGSDFTLYWESWGTVSFGGQG